MSKYMAQAQTTIGREIRDYTCMDIRRQLDSEDEPS